MCWDDFSDYYCASILLAIAIRQSKRSHSVICSNKTVSYNWLVNIMHITLIEYSYANISIILI